MDQTLWITHCVLSFLVGRWPAEQPTGLYLELGWLLLLQGFAAGNFLQLLLQWLQALLQLFLRGREDEREG